MISRPDLQPPVARRIPHPITQHGETRNDPYFWLRERDNPDVIAYLEAENRYANATLSHTADLQARLYAEMRGRIKETDQSAPVRNGDYWYYTRTEEGRQYPIYCRKRGSLDAPEEVLLDQNALAVGEVYCRIGVFKPSPDHRLLAYSVDTSGNEQYTLFIKDLDSGELRPDRVPNTYYSVEWANDNRTLFYNVLDAAMRPYQVLRHTLGADATGDVLVYHEPDEAFFVAITKTRSTAYLLLELGSTSTREVWFGRADQPDAPFTVIAPRRHGIEYMVEHHDDRFLIVTNEDAQNFKLVEAPVATPGHEHWRELIGHRPTVLIDGIDAFRDYLVLYERERGLRQIRISDPQGDNVRYVPFPEPVYTFTPGPNEMYDSAVLRFTYSSLVTPNSVIDYNMRTGTWEVKKQDEIPSGYDAAQYVSERIMATAPDGVQVPISLVYKRGIVRNGSNPTLLYGYGSYGVTIEPSFAAQRLSLLDRGFIYAIAHIRGGADLGRAWYDDGKLMRKQNTFTDFIACAEHLIAEGYTSPDHLAIMGRSAGGLLMGAVMTMRPDLFKAVLALVPFVDVINTMSDPTLPLTVTEYEQWGNPNERAAYDYMRSYSPYDNVQPKNYPHLLLMAGLNDPRVAYWEPAKFAARLRALKTDDHRLLLLTDMEVGHSGPSGRYEHLKETALHYAFLLDTLGVPES